MFTWVDREDNVFTSDYNNLTGFYNYVDFGVEYYSNNYFVGI